MSTFENTYTLTKSLDGTVRLYRNGKDVSTVIAAPEWTLRIAVPEDVQVMNEVVVPQVPA